MLKDKKVSMKERKMMILRPFNDIYLLFLGESA